MKAQQRKELQTNVLADSLGRFVRSVKSGSNNNIFYLICLAILLVGGGVILWKRLPSSAEKTSALWVTLTNADSVEKLDQIVKDKAGTTEGRVARVERARKRLQQGQEKLFSNTDRKKALEDLAKAGEDYEVLANETADMPTLEQEALMASAKIREALGDFDGPKGAKHYYEKLVAKHPNSLLGKRAAEALAELQERTELSTALAKLEEEARKKAPPPALPDKKTGSFPPIPGGAPLPDPVDLFKRPKGDKPFGPAPKP